MKRIVKRMTALILVLAMAMSLLSANVWAAEVMAQENGSVSAKSEEKGIQKEAFSEMKLDKYVDVTEEKSENAQQTKELYEGQNLDESVDVTKAKCRNSECGEDSLEATEAEGPEITMDANAGAEHNETIEAENHIPDLEEEREPDETSDEDGSIELRAQAGDETITESLEDLIQQLPDADDLDDDRYFYYKQLNDFQKVVYWKILDSIKNNYDTIEIDLNDYQVSYKDMSIICAAVKFENPMTSVELSGSYSSSVGDNNVFEYHLCKRYISKYRRDKLNARLDQIIATINKGDSYSKVINLMQFINKHIVYDYDSGYLKGGTGTDNANTLIGPLLYNMAVCEGFALLIKTVCDEVGVPCLIVEGEAPGAGENMLHAWNLIRMEDGQWYLVDGVTISADHVFESNAQIAESVLKGLSYKNRSHDLYGGINSIGLNLENHTDISVPRLAEEDYTYKGTYDFQSYEEAENHFVETEGLFLYQANEDGSSCSITGYEGLQEGDIVIPEEIDGLTVTEIGINAFYENTGFDGSIIIPDSVTEIQEGAFFKCSNLNGSLVLPKNLISIGERAFMGCENIEGSLKLPATLKKINNNAFANCKKLSGEVYLSQYIEDYHLSSYFYNTPGITSYIVDENNTELCSVDGVIYSKDLSRLILCPCGKEQISIPDSVTTIEESALACCSKLNFDLKNLPPHLTTIKDYSFQNVNIEGDFVFPETLEYIGNSVFSNHSDQAKTITFPKSLTHVGSMAFFGYNITGEVIIPNSISEFEGDSIMYGGCPTYVCDCDNESLISWYEEHAIVSSDLALRKRHKYVPSTVSSKYIEGFDHISSVEYKCELCGKVIRDLQSEYTIVSQGGDHYGTVHWKIDEKGNMLICGSGSMWGGYGHVIPESLQNSVRVIIIQSGITNVGHNAFQGFSNVSEVFCPESVASIDALAFEHCINLKRVILSEGLETLDDYCFFECGIDEILIPSSVNYMGTLSVYGVNSDLSVKDTIIKGYAGTCAEEYAKDRPYTFIDVAKYPEHKSLGGHQWDDGATTKAATCTEMGTKTFNCSVCDCTKTEEIAIDPANHTGSTERRNSKSTTCTEDGYTGDIYCLGCGEKLTDGEAIPALGHNWSEWVTTKEATEDEEGEEQRVCKNDGTHTESRAINKLSHVHNLTKHDAKAATCKEEGNIVYWSCSKCHKLFSDAEGKTETTQAATVISAKGHQLTKTDAKAATCTEDGNSAYWSCSECKKLFSDAQGKTETTQTDIVIGKSHQLTKTDAKAASCTENGNAAYWSCSECHKLFSDAKGKTETSLSETVICAPGHDTFRIAAKEPTCNESGNIAYWECNRCGKLYVDEKAAREIAQADTLRPATGKHNWDAGTVTTQPTTTTEGVKTYTCTVCGQTRTESVAKLPQPQTEEKTETKPEPEPEPTTAPVEKNANTITSKDLIFRTYNAKKNQSFKLGVKVKGGVKLSYKSSNKKKVTIAKNGKVTIKKGFMGQATITVTASETAKYKKAQKKITLMVGPSGTQLSSVKYDAKKKVINAAWKKNTTGKGYEIQISLKKDFKKVDKKVKINKNATIKTAIKGLKKGTYYVRIRTINGKAYSDWSKTKTVKVK